MISLLWICSTCLTLVAAMQTHPHAMEEGVSLGFDFSEAHDDDFDMSMPQLSRRVGVATENPNSESIIYDHMPKAGGTFLQQLIKAAVGRRAFSHLSEFSPVSRKQEHQSFIVGSIRNPCDYYVSLWSYGSEGRGMFQSKLPEEFKYVYSNESVEKDTLGDIQKFQQWLHVVNKPKLPGTLSLRLATSYAGFGRLKGLWGPASSYADEKLQFVQEALDDFEPSKIDCWVKTEDLEGGARRCLEIYQNNTGHDINWTNFDLALHHKYQKTSVHAPCKLYFQNQTVLDFIQETDGEVFGMFGYDKCCSD